MPERIPQILKALEEVSGQVTTLSSEIEKLREEVTISEEVAETANKASRRAWHLTWFDLVLTLVAFVLGGFLTVALIHSNDAQHTSQRNAQTQYQSCIQTNQSRTDIQGFLVGLLTQAEGTIKAQRATLPANQVAAYDRAVAFYDGQITLAKKDFAVRDCTPLKP